MIHSPRFIAVLDACVLYPVPIRDLLLSLASAGLYKPKWSALIQDEWSPSAFIKSRSVNRFPSRKSWLNFGGISCSIRSESNAS